MLKYTYNHTDYKSCQLPTYLYFNDPVIYRIGCVLLALKFYKYWLSEYWCTSNAGNLIEFGQPYAEMGQKITYRSALY